MWARLIPPAGAAFLAAVHVVGVLLGSPVWPPALVAALLVLAAGAALGGEPRWLGPVALAPLVLQAALTIPRVRTGGYTWSVSYTGLEPPPSTSSLVLDALDNGFRLAGAPLLFAAVLLVAARTGPGKATKTVLATGFLVLAYAVTRVVDTVLDIHDRSSAGRGAFGGNESGTYLAAGCAVLVPVGLALTAASLGAVTRRRWGVFGALLLVASALPMIDSALDAVPMSGSDGATTRLFGWDFLTPSIAVPAPVPALTVALQLTGFLLVTKSRPIRRYGG